jgi:hypothetical protein
MNHPSEDALLLFAYGDPEADDLTRHLGDCAACRARLQAIERARVAVELVVSRARVPRPALRWAVIGLAAAAGLALVLLRPRPVTPPLAIAVPRYAIPELAPIDSMLTRLEQERIHAIP